MPIQLRTILIVGAVGTMVYFIGEIRKNQLQIKHALFWTVGSLILVIMSLLPTKVYEVIRYVGLQSPTNFVFLILIFALIIRQFSDTVKISVLERKLAILTQRIALMKLDEEKQAEAIKHTLGNGEISAETEKKEKKPGGKDLMEGQEETPREDLEQPGEDTAEQ